ncbi:NPR2-domain-containing protein [Phellopilus nigrolimitatus]|nr:NPR2-domain-containing protein [Phellopilus nigrolimitatus]
MASDGNSFLPRILSVFYAVFHDNKGTNIVYQVPEGLIATSPAEKLEPPSTRTSISRNSAGPSRASSSSHYSSYKRPSSTNRCLFKFEDISRYVIPPSALCGRLVTCTTRGHQVLGFPVGLYNQKRYERNFFRYNVCFVFDSTADLSCYEPIVRKVGRVLTSCEEESSFLTSPETSHGIYAILEQLYEDLNSYSETSIPIDEFNSIELKIFPFYPNPPEVHDWSVPVALINLKKRIEDNWDLTMAKVCLYIDGTNHVGRIAYLADCDLDLTRKAVQHLLFYQVIMMIDIFQFSNMYTLCRSIAWLADEPHVQDECGPYVTRPDREISEWPDLLHLYSRLKPGITVFEWMQEYDTHKHGIDPRRFVSFGVIKGFLRRVHRWPVLIPAATTEKEKERERRASSASFGRRRGKSLTMHMAPLVGPKSPGATTPPIVADAAFNRNSISFSRNIDTSLVGTAATSSGPGRHALQPEGGDRTRTLSTPMRRASVAEKYQEQKFRREIDNAPAALTTGTGAGAGELSTANTQRYSRAYQGAGAQDAPLGRRHSLVQPLISYASAATSGLPNSTSMLSSSTTTEYGVNGETSGLPIPTAARPRLSRSPSSQVAVLAQMPGLKELLDGTRHTDELGVRFELGWPALEKLLITIGGGKGDGDFGRVEIIYR